MAKKAKKKMAAVALVDVSEQLDQTENARLRTALDAANVAIAKQAQQIMDLKRMKGVKV